jgi:myo-inositol-1(or 4)-monophosphatase
VSGIEHARLIKIALEAVLAGAQMAERLGPSAATGHKGSLRDIVTAADLAIGDLLETRLEATGLPVVSEERFAVDDPMPDVFWAVDPIDGTVNFAHSLPMYVLSAGLAEKNEFPLGVVCAPALDELYFTLNPEKALFNGRPFEHVHGPMQEALIAASFAARGDRSQYDLFQQANESSRGCLRSGSAGLNICWAAAGKLQAAYGFQAKLWDVAGALAIARAAGCAVALQRRPGSVQLDYVVGSREVVEQLAKLARNLGLWGNDGRGSQRV